MLPMTEDVNPNGNLIKCLKSRAICGRIFHEVLARIISDWKVPWYIFPANLIMHPSILYQYFLVCVGFSACEYCGKVYPVKYPASKNRAFYNHITYDCHRIPPKFKCKLCPYTARRQFMITKHCSTEHSQS